MPWARVDDGLHSHPKIRRAWKCRPALGLHLMALSYCGQCSPDGLVPVEWVEENRAVPTVAADASGKALLDGGCYVRSIQDRLLKSRGTVKFGPMITAADGAKFQSLFYIEAARGASPVAAFGERDVILFVSAGKGAIEVSGRRFAAGENAGVHVRPGEAFRMHNDADAPMKVFAAACPLADDIAWAETMPAIFDAAHPDRVVALDPAMRVSMGARFFQLLVDMRIGSTVVTQFIGEIPLSKAAPHRHLYATTDRA